ncbi:hypothetical protein COSO111634_05855 [Corallococcus soli]
MPLGTQQHDQGTQPLAPWHMLRNLLEGLPLPGHQPNAGRSCVHGPLPSNVILTSGTVYPLHELSSGGLVGGAAPEAIKLHALDDGASGLRAC